MRTFLFFVAGRWRRDGARDEPAVVEDDCVE